MITTRPLCAEDDAPFLAVCETSKGYFVVLNVTYFDYFKDILHGEIVQGFGEPKDGLAAGCRGEYRGTHSWLRLISDKHAWEKERKEATNAFNEHFSVLQSLPLSERQSVLRKLHAVIGIRHLKHGVKGRAVMRHAKRLCVSTATIHRWIIRFERDGVRGLIDQRSFSH